MSTKLHQTLKGYLKLFTAIAVVWGLTFWALPALTRSSESIQTLANFIDFSGIDTGRYYYTDVEVVTQADIGIRSTFEYYAHK